jgi:glutathione S-transferase
MASSGSKLSIFTWQAFGDVASISPQCVEVLTVLRFCGLEQNKDFIEIASNNPTMSPSHKLPFASVQVSENKPTELLADDQAILKYLKEKVHDLDGAYPPHAVADILAYTSMVRDMLEPMLSYTWWVDPANTSEMKHILAGHLPVVLNWYMPSRLFNQAKQQLDYMNKSNPDALFDRAIAAYESLSNRLGSSPYFMGEKPCSLDAALFAHLQCVQLKLPNNPLLKELDRFPNLKRFYANIQHKFYRNKPEPITQHPAPPTHRRYARSPEADDKAWHFYMNVAVAVGLTALTAYFAKNRVVSVMLPEPDLPPMSMPLLPYHR